MNYVLAAVATILASESVFRLPLRSAVKVSVSTTRKSIRVIRSPHISDHWKEQVLLKYMTQLLTESLRVLLMCTVVIGMVVLVALLGNLLGQDLFHFLMTWEGIIAVTVVSIGYIMVRKRFG